MRVAGVLGHQVGPGIFEIDVYVGHGRIYRIFERSTNVNAARAKARRRILRDGADAFELRQVGE